jgi:type II secretory pathway pseudopilin PulG
METARHPGLRFQYSLRTLFVVTAIVALLLVPVAWVARQRQQMLEAREAALRAVILAERDRTLAVQARYHAALRAQSNGSALPDALEAAEPNPDDPSSGNAPQHKKAANTPPPTVEQLLRKNAELKKTVENLEREIDRLKSMKTH